VTATGVVELWHPACHAQRDVPIAAAPVDAVVPSRSPSRRLIRWALAGVGASSVVSVAVAQYVWLESAPPVEASIANVDLAPRVDPPSMPRIATRTEPVPQYEAHVDTELEAKYPVPTVGARLVPDREVLAPVLALADLKLAELGRMPGEDDRPLDELFPSLRGWTHPVTNSPELYPPLPARHFGAKRFGITPRPECGEGHCGVDLDGPRGRPVVAVAAGTVVRVERHELGLDGRSGRYVRIEHEDGVLTAYMHMDDVEDHLHVGEHVVAGQYLGTLGATATFSSPPHLHFSVEIPNQPGLHGDNTDTHYVDPAPFLVRATIEPGPRDVSSRPVHVRKTSS
jgi:murein DD-endopeptidase MepM/ murein hydrolase activator NlpD